MTTIDDLLKEYQDITEAINSETQSLKETITMLQQQVSSIEDTAKPQLSLLKEQIEALVKEQHSTFKNEFVELRYVKPSMRSTWNDKTLRGFFMGRPEFATTMKTALTETLVNERVEWRYPKESQ